MEREVGRRPVRIDVGEAAGHVTLAAGRLLDCILRGVLDRVVEFFESLLGDRRLERVVDDAPEDQPLHRVGHADEGVAPIPAQLA
jgi:hypothetical protein